jgi:hypothetical protein
VLIWVVGDGNLYLDETNTEVFFRNPGTALVHAAILQYTPANTDILPTFVLLHLVFPIVLWLLIRSATVALAISFLLYPTQMVQLLVRSLVPLRSDTATRNHGPECPASGV